MSTFTIPFPEYDIAYILEKKFPKNQDFSIAIPLTRQQKHYDLILLNGKNRKVVAIQVKSSRVYYDFKKYDHFESWHKCFDIKNNYSDFYFFYILYPLLDKDFRPRARWDKKILVFNANEMANVLRTQKHSFGFRISAIDDKVRGGRGFNYDDEPLTKHLLENQIVNLNRRLKSTA